MLPRPADNGARLAAVVPTCIAALEKYRTRLSVDSIAKMFGTSQALSELFHTIEQNTVPARNVLIVVVDGLGYENFTSRRGHAHALSSLHTQRIETVIPSTTGAALPSLTTARLPGAHGLLGYKIRHETEGLINTLNEWDLVPNHDEWQRCTTMFTVAQQFGIHSTAIGRPAHQFTPFTQSVLRGAHYLPAQTIEERFTEALTLLNNGSSQLVYLYIDELDKAGHRYGWQSEAWLHRLEQFDAALEHLLAKLQEDVGIVVTSDHGMIDVQHDDLIVLDRGELGEFLSGISLLGGEPRMRSVYMKEPGAASQLSDRLGAYLHNVAYVGTREEAVSNNWFGNISTELALRFGDVVITPKKQVGFVTSSEKAHPNYMIGQHGGLTESERGVILALGGVFKESSYRVANKHMSSLVQLM